LDWRKDAIMRMPSKVVSVLCVLQIFIVIGGFLVVGALVKFYYKLHPLTVHPVTASLSAGVNIESRLSALTEFVRADGLWFLLIPVAWCLLAAWRSEGSDGEAAISGPQLMTGVVLTVGLGAVFGASFANAIKAAFW
jgi:hypothetical protein